jgi:putative flavoprotein involved in K+ transport
LNVVDVVIVGAGQAGLSISHELTRRSLAHVVIDRARIGEAWRRRWDSFCLVSPNWTVRLAGQDYDGPDPDGFMLRDEVVAYLERYAASFGAPVRENLPVVAVERSGGGYTVTTADGVYRSRALVVASGAYQRVHWPDAVASLPAAIHRMNLHEYSSPATVPPGDVLILGSGQSGCQIAEELHAAGRRVVLACGRTPYSPRQVAGRDCFWWLLESGFLDAGPEGLPHDARLLSTPVVSGHDGGYDLDLRILAAQGVTLVGRFLGYRDGKAQFADDLGQSVAWGDARFGQFVESVLRPTAARHGIALPPIGPPGPIPSAGPGALDLRGFGTVLVTLGFRPEYSRWLPWPEAFDAQGFPHQKDGASTVVEGLYFIGMPLLRNRKSPILLGAGEDAAIVASQVAAAVRA